MLIAKIMSASKYREILLAGIQICDHKVRLSKFCLTFWLFSASLGVEAGVPKTGKSKEICGLDD